MTAISLLVFLTCSPICNSPRSPLLRRQKSCWLTAATSTILPQFFGGVSKVMRHLSIAMCYIWTSASHTRRNHLLVCSSEMLFHPKMVSSINFYDDQCDIDVSSSRWRYERFFFLCQVYVEVQRNVLICVQYASGNTVARDISQP